MRLRTIAAVAIGLAALAGGCGKKVSEDTRCQPYYEKGHAACLAECEKQLKEQVQEQKEEAISVEGVVMTEQVYDYRFGNAQCRIYGIDSTSNGEADHWAAIYGATFDPLDTGNKVRVKLGKSIVFSEEYMNGKLIKMEGLQVLEYELLE